MFSFLDFNLDFAWISSADAGTESLSVLRSRRRWFGWPALPFYVNVTFFTPTTLRRICTQTAWPGRKVLEYEINTPWLKFINGLQSVFVKNRVVLDRVYTPLDAAWGCLHGGDGRASRRPSHHQKVLSEELKEEIRTSWKHFRPSSPPLPDTSANIPSPPSVAGIDCVSICADDDDKYQTFDTETIDQVWWPDPLSAIQADPADVSTFHPSCGHSNFNVVGDDIDSTYNHLDWWNYFDTDFVSASPPPPPPPPPDDSAASGGGRACHTTTSNCIINGVNSPSTATDSPFWIVPKSASLPNNDW